MPTAAQRRNRQLAVDFFKTFDPEPLGGVVDMTTWGEHPTTSHEPDACGTVACALGWLAVQRVIPGLLTIWETYEDKVVLEPTYTDEDGRRHKYTNGVARALGISEGSAANIFMAAAPGQTLQSVGRLLEAEFERTDR